MGENKSHAMGKYKENTKYNVLSLRVTDDEKSAMDEICRCTRKSISMLVREAIQHYGPFREIAAKIG
jgi:predicted transcriptional regulator